MEHYHKRSNSETAYSMIKAKFGGSVRSKLPVAQVNEVLLKVLCHNICVLIQSIYELGLEPTFWNLRAETGVIFGQSHRERRGIMPNRIQRRRTKGWRMPLNTVYVGRPTKWGNPFLPSGCLSLERSLRLYRELLSGSWNPRLLEDFSDGDYHMYYLHRTSWLKRFYGINVQFPGEYASRELGGKALACWCPLDRPCHADVLLKVANAEPSFGALL